MSKKIACTLAAASLATGALAAPVPSAATQAARQAEIAFQMQTSGTAQVVEVIDPTVPVLRFASQTEGVGSFGLTGYLSTDIINMATGQGSGSNRFVAPNGDELLGTFTVQVLPDEGSGTLRLQGLTTFTGGTGAFAGASGTASLQGRGRFVSDTKAVVQFDHQGRISLVPEPASTALVLAGLAALGAQQVRRRGS